MFDIRILVLAVIATLLPKALGFVRCPKVDWPYDYVCFNDEYCCEVEQCCKDEQCCDHISFGAMVGISFGVFAFVCIVMFCCFIKHAQRGVIRPSNDVGQEPAVVHISPRAERTSEQTTRIELPDPITRLHQPTRVSYSSSRQQPTTTWTTSEPDLPMYGYDSYSNHSPPPSYTSQQEYSPPPTPPPVTFTRRTGH
ncbi:uncharacterized protein LOC128230834 [Mya arenaria]|uniref:uncharacterized protein LOC128230834 n=1 Tax=Mya arenaria TaxID=6604 RepID=UPI0022E0E537|nr:uncharacterized protein LOC128230834 [Mya arenaria]